MEIWQLRDKAEELITTEKVETEESRKRKKKKSKVYNKWGSQETELTYLKVGRSKKVGIDKVYPGHIEALHKAGLVEQHFPTFGEV
eukprot:13321732-Ditylum_brightwellii.AAC.1